VERKRKVLQSRALNLSRRIANGDPKSKIKTLEKNYKKTLPYIHLTFSERKQFLVGIAECIGRWSDTRVFFHAIDKNACDESRLREDGLYATAFQELISRFQLFLDNKGRHDNLQYEGLVVSDNNQDVEKKITSLSRRIHKSGTRLGTIHNIIETPLFVNSETTCMVQLADLVAYSIRRCIEKNELDLFDHISKRIDRAGSAIVGGRHYTWGKPCNCKICQEVHH